jgi:hypothetical protein
MLTYLIYNDLIVEDLVHFLNINVLRYLNRIFNVRPCFLVPVCISALFRLCKLPTWLTDFFLLKKQKKRHLLFQSPTKCR